MQSKRRKGNVFWSISEGPVVLSCFGLGTIYVKEWNNYIENKKQQEMVESTQSCWFMLYPSRTQSLKCLTGKCKHVGLESNLIHVPREISFPWNIRLSSHHWHSVIPAGKSTADMFAPGMAWRQAHTLSMYLNVATNQRTSTASACPQNWYAIHSTSKSCGVEMVARAPTLWKWKRWTLWFFHVLFWTALQLPSNERLVAASRVLSNLAVGVYYRFRGLKTKTVQRLVLSQEVSSRVKDGVSSLKWTW